MLQILLDNLQCFRRYEIVIDFPFLNRLNNSKINFQTKKVNLFKNYAEKNLRKLLERNKIFTIGRYNVLLAWKHLVSTSFYIFFSALRLIFIESVSKVERAKREKFGKFSGENYSIKNKKEINDAV